MLQYAFNRVRLLYRLGCSLLYRRLKWDQTENFETESIQTTRLVHSSGGVDCDEYIKGSLEADGLATEHVIWIRHGRLDEHVLRANRMAKIRPPPLYMDAKAVVFHL